MVPKVVGSTPTVHPAECGFQTRKPHFFFIYGLSNHKLLTSSRLRKSVYSESLYCYRKTITLLHMLSKICALIWLFSAGSLNLRIISGKGHEARKPFSTHSNRTHICQIQPTPGSGKRHSAALRAHQADAWREHARYGAPTAWRRSRSDAR